MPSQEVLLDSMALKQLRFYLQGTMESNSCCNLTLPSLFTLCVKALGSFDPLHEGIMSLHLHGLQEMF